MGIIQTIKRKTENWKIAKQGGEKTSSLLRRITEERYEVSVGMYSYGSCFDPKFNTGGKVVIGKYCSFGPDVRYFGANHPLDSVSMSPYFYQQTWADSANGLVKVKDVKRHCLMIGNDCWIGCGVIITSGCHSIGDGAVIGAGTIVTKDIEPYSIVAGNPARHIRYRFNEETIKELINSKWYEFNPKELLQFYNYHDQPQIFAAAVNEYRNTKQ